MNKQEIEKRIIHYKDLVPCKNAFVDTRTPGSNKKENFTLIGPGVSENPDQYVHIKEPHGFNIGGARQPAGCLNSQHSHLTAEVFIVHTGKWLFKFGINGDEGSVELNEGDTINIPIHMFRGFENIGGDVGFLFAILGRDDPGKVTWAPSVFELAKKYGLILLRGGRLIDTTKGEEVPAGAELELPPTTAEIARLATPEKAKLDQCVIRFAGLSANPNSSLKTDGVEEAGVITPSDTGDGFTAGAGMQPWWENGFNLRKISIKSGSSTEWYSRQEAEVIFVQSGELTFTWEADAEGNVEENAEASEQQVTLEKGATMTTPKGLKRKLQNKGSDDAELFVVLGGDSPGMPRFY